MVCSASAISIYSRGSTVIGLVRVVTGECGARVRCVSELGVKGMVPAMGIRSAVAGFGGRCMVVGVSSVGNIQGAVIDGNQVCVRVVDECLVNFTSFSTSLCSVDFATLSISLRSMKLIVRCFHAGEGFTTWEGDRV